MILPVESKEISRRLRQYLPEFARPLLDRLIERVKYETQQEIALEQEQRRRKEEITQNVLGEAGPAAGGLEERIRISAAGLEEIRRQFGPYFDQIVDVDGWTAAVRRGDDPTPYMHPGPLGQATATPIADMPQRRRLEYDDRIAFIVQHLAGPRPDLADLEDQQRAREELIQAAEQAD